MPRDRQGWVRRGGGGGGGVSVSIPSDVLSSLSTLLLPSTSDPTPSSTPTNIVTTITGPLPTTGSIIIIGPSSGSATASVPIPQTNSQQQTSALPSLPPPTVQPPPVVALISTSSSSPASATNQSLTASSPITSLNTSSSTLNSSTTTLPSTTTSTRSTTTLITTAIITVSPNNSGDNSSASAAEADSTTLSTLPTIISNSTAQNSSDSTPNTGDNAQGIRAAITVGVIATILVLGLFLCHCVIKIRQATQNLKRRNNSQPNFNVNSPVHVNPHTDESATPTRKFMTETGRSTPVNWDPARRPVIRASSLATSPTSPLNHHISETSPIDFSALQGTGTNRNSLRVMASLPPTPLQDSLEETYPPPTHHNHQFYDSYYHHHHQQYHHHNGNDPASFHPQQQHLYSLQAGVYGTSPPGMVPSSPGNEPSSAGGYTPVSPVYTYQSYYSRSEVPQHCILTSPARSHRSVSEREYGSLRSHTSTNELL